MLEPCRVGFGALCEQLRARGGSRVCEPRETAGIPRTAPARASLAAPAALLALAACPRQMFVLEIPARWAPRPCGPWTGSSARAVEEYGADMAPGFQSAGNYGKRNLPQTEMELDPAAEMIWL